MSPPVSSSQNKIVLLGVGHTNAHVLNRWRTKPIPNAELICISNHSVATYSGMLPAVLAGQKPHSAMEIDLVKLCSAANATFIHDDVTHLDSKSRTLSFKKSQTISFDALSIGIGSVPATSRVELFQKNVVPIKPMQTFLERLSTAIRLAQKTANKTINAVVVGGGAAGVEISMCLRSHFDQLKIYEQFQIDLINRGHELVTGSAARARTLIEKKLEALNIQRKMNCEVTSCSGNQIHFADGSSQPADVVIWATGAAAPPLLSSLSLPVDERGFLLTDETLSVQVDAPIFAVGDTGTIQGEDVPKAGVYAVREGPVLWENIQRILDNHPLQKYRPQRSFLRLLNCGDGNGIAEWYGLAFQGKWVMWLKDRIDSKFVEQYQL